MNGTTTIPMSHINMNYDDSDSQTRRKVPGMLDCEGGAWPKEPGITQVLCMTCETLRNTHLYHLISIYIT